jgi:hypothetical protein
VPIQIINLSLEEVEMSKHTTVGVASPIFYSEIEDHDDYGIHNVQTEKGKRENSNHQF